MSIIPKIFTRKKVHPIKTGLIPSQAYIIEQIIRSCNIKSYLELGISYGTTYQHIKDLLEIAHAVDIVDIKFIDRNSFFLMSTDVFFAQNKNTYDMIFIDASHEFRQVKKDFQNSVKILNEEGLIILHDTNPQSRELLVSNRCGDSFKMNDWLRGQKKYQFITIPMDEAGLTLVNVYKDLRYKRFE